VSTISGNGGLNQMALLTIWFRCRKKECSGVYIAGFFSLSAYRYSAERLSGVAKAQTFVRSPPIYVKSVRVMV
jgi:hypothetical protein